MRKNDHLALAFGSKKVVGATTMIGGTLIRDGEARFTLDGVTFLGELDGTHSERVNRIVGAFVRSGFKATATNHIQSIEWSKQALQSPFAALSVITKLSVDRVWASPELARLSVYLFREVASVARAHGVELSRDQDWSLFNMEVLCNGKMDDAVEMVLDVGEKALAGGKPRIIPSMLQDVMDGRQTEIEETVGYVFKEGKRFGIPVPYTEFAYGTIKAIEQNYKNQLR
jgi:2-dehydropantoate 2-reductase